MINNPGSPWTTDDIGWYRWPNYAPAPLDGYQYLADGPVLYSRPPIRMRHRVWFWLVNLIRVWQR